MGGSYMRTVAASRQPLMLALELARPAAAQDWQMPPENQRCPSKWGADDQRGSANMMKPRVGAARQRS